MLRDYKALDFAKKCAIMMLFLANIVLFGLIKLLFLEIYRDFFNRLGYQDYLQ